MSIEELKNSQRLADHLAGNLKKPSLSTAYRRAYTGALAMLEDPEMESQDLAAKTWALMACLSVESKERYGPQAIASNDVHQRLDIITKAFLEEQVASTENMMSISTDDQEMTGFE